MVIEIKKQEKEYRNNFHRFAKEITNGTFEQPSVNPSYSLDAGNQFYKKKYSKSVEIDFAKLSWFHKVDQPQEAYDLTPYTQKDIEEALKHKSPHSAPGDDNILYEYLKKLPSTHIFLATLFTVIRDSSEAPEAWSSSRIILIPK